MSHDLLPRIAALLGAASSNEQGAQVLREVAAERQCAVETLLDRVALEAARGFDGGSVSYEEAIGLMAAVHAAMLGDGALYTAAGESFAAKVYWALDEGEYGVESDAGLDPIATRVRPMIKQLLREASASNDA